MDEKQLWYKDAVIYEVHVKAFYDSDGDGIGDFQGLTQKLDYLQDLGVTTLWLLPFYPSPLKDDGYDISDYVNIHPQYGTLQDFKIFLKEAHRRGLYVITELVMNHTSDQHPWFQRARRSPPGSPWRDFYVWSTTPEKYKGARIIFKDFEPSNWSWDPVAQAYYWHRFYAHQPDLNFDNPKVRKTMLQLLDFWLGLGVDGVRLDAVPYLFEREGTNCENIAETHAFLKEVRQHMDRKFKNRMLLAEANQWPEDVLPYFGSGNECHMAFHFPVMPRLFMAIHTEDRFPIIDILQQTPEIPQSCQWALFLRNHDELTLEMVTDEDRDYMYRVYGNDPKARLNLGIRRRLAPLLGNHRRKIELMNSLLFSLPGTPVIYYADEIGMGDNIYLGDRNGVRTPMQWSSDRNAGFSRANPQKLHLPIIIDPEYHYEAINVEAQQSNPHSLLWWMKRMIALRKQYKAFSRGTLEFLQPENRKVLVFLRHWNNEHILVVANLSRFVQCAELDLSAFRGQTPVEMFGRTPFPPIGELPYFITLGPHAFYWFVLEPPRSAVPPPVVADSSLPNLEVPGEWETVFETRKIRELEHILVNYLKARRWFGGKSKQLRGVKIWERVPIAFGPQGAYVTILAVTYAEGVPENYVLPMSFAAEAEAGEIKQTAPGFVVTELSATPNEGVIFDPLGNHAFCTSLLEAIRRQRRFAGSEGEIVGTIPSGSRDLAKTRVDTLPPSISKAEQSNTSVVYGDRFILKVFRRVDEGTNPDLEIGLFLAERTSFANVPRVLGALEYRRKAKEPMTLALVHSFVPNQGDAWRYTLDSLGRYFEEALARSSEAKDLELPFYPILDLMDAVSPALAAEVIGTYLPSAQLLGQRTAELHRALASDPADPAFAPEPFSAFDRRSLYQSLRTSSEQSFQLLNRAMRAGLPEDVRSNAEKVLEQSKDIVRKFHGLVEHDVSGLRIRCHGDYHLGQVLYTGKDFVIIDFEGEPTRSLSERRLKRSPLRDVAGMLRSFHYASVAKLKNGQFRPEDISSLLPWSRFWHLWVSVAFLKSYLSTIGESSILPISRADVQLLLDLHLLEKNLYEIRYELNHRPDWLNIPLQGILQLMAAHRTP